MTVHLNIKKYLVRIFPSSSFAFKYCNKKYKPQAALQSLLASYWPIIESFAKILLPTFLADVGHF